MTAWQKCAGSFPAVSYGSFLESENVAEVSQAAVLSCDLKGLEFPNVMVESEKVLIAFPYTYFIWLVVEFLNMQYLCSAVNSPKSFKTARECAFDYLSHSVFSAQFERQADTGLRAQFRREPCSRVLCTSAPGPHPRPAPALARGCPPGPAGRSDRPRPPALPSLRLRTSHAALAQTTT
ncbi:unnamed protein product [Rangifer tarandus platyrhynchus]|uniref:Uncharacterized protein n=2 Tax=Rangifer tarandus platyrhynchus TaxID=3082113 RepID=A0ABN8Y1V8_RANTA|nr:unnamed protein product [Rangifer tarandus platyrhynchus]CAI9693160.1 unnamed protein product [Rangifer tarandus platyrhynchus]